MSNLIKAVYDVRWKQLVEVGSKSEVKIKGKQIVKVVTVNSDDLAGVE